MLRFQLWQSTQCLTRQTDCPHYRFDVSYVRQSSINVKLPEMGMKQDRRYKAKHKYWQIIGGQATGQSNGHVCVVKGSLIYGNSARVVVKPWNGSDNTKILEDETLGPRVSNDRRQAHSSFPSSIKYRRVRGSRKRYIIESAICRQRGDAGILGDDIPLESEYW
jgi:hypothetical protein